MEPMTEQWMERLRALADVVEKDMDRLGRWAPEMLRGPLGLEMLDRLEGAVAEMRKAMGHERHPRRRIVITLDAYDAIDTVEANVSPAVMGPTLRELLRRIDGQSLVDFRLGRLATLRAEKKQMTASFHGVKRCEGCRKVLREDRDEYSWDEDLHYACATCLPNPDAPEVTAVMLRPEGEFTGEFGDGTACEHDDPPANDDFSDPTDDTMF